MTPDQVAIVVVNWNRSRETIDCLESLEQADLGGASVLVVDNGSRDGSVDAIRARFPGREIVALEHNMGFAGGSNAGMRAALAAGAEGVLLLNNDAVVAPDFLGWLLDVMNTTPRCAAASSAVMRMDRPEMLEVAYTQLRFDLRYVVQLIGVNALPGEGFDRRREVEVAVACCLLLSAEALRTVGLFDEAYFAYHEDVDWCIRARRAGYRIVYEPCSRVFHRQSSSTSRLRPRPPMEDTAPWEPRLPNAEPAQWNPVRAYLGARNVVRLLRAYATDEQRRAFIRRHREDLPLEFFAVVLGREGKMRLGHWSYRHLVRFYFIERHRLLRQAPQGRGAKLVRALALLIFVPVDLFWALPRDIVRALRQGRTDEFVEYVRGLWDGFRDRPLPLERLGLR